MKEYKYPNNLDLEPSSSDSMKIVGKLLAMLDRGYSNISSVCHPRWRATETYLNCFVQQPDGLVRYFRPTEGQSQTNSETIIMIPYSLAVLETMQAQIFTALNRPNLFSFVGVDAEDVLKAKLLELVVGHDVKKNDTALALHTLVRDDLVYGAGIAAPTYCKENNKGNVLINIDPYRYIPDPSVPINDPQKGEFVAWSDTVNIFQQMRLEAKDKTYFNAQYLKKYESFKRSRFVDGDRFLADYLSDNNFDVVHVYCDLFPAEYGLSESEEPERWYFMLAADSVILCAKRMGLKHGEFPIVVGSSGYDGHNFIMPSRVTTLMGMQSVLDWLVSSHITNVRQSINNRFLVDPSMVNAEDVAKGRPLIRLRRFQWGRGVDNVMKQLQIYDTTQGHIRDASYMSDLIKTVSGVDEAAMGILRQSGPERLTSAEANNTYSGLQSRLGRIVTVLSMQVLRNVGRQFGHNTVQLMPEKTFVRLTGRWAEDLAKIYGTSRIEVLRDKLDVSFDTEVDAEFLTQTDKMALMKALEMVGSNQQLNQEFDVVQLFKAVLTSQGLKNVDDFIRRNPNPQMQVIPDQAVPQLSMEAQVNEG